MIFEWETARSLALAALVGSVVALVADRRRIRRIDPDAVGWMPWGGLSIIALLLAMVFGLVALQGWLRS